MADAYTPSDGLKNIASFPTDPADEAAARKQIQDMFDQILAFHNAKHISCRVHNSANQSIPDSALTVLAFDSESFDDNGIHDTSTNNSRLTCKTAGRYIAILNLFFADSVTGVRGGSILLNGLESFAVTGPTGSPRLIVTSPVMDMSIGDYVQAAAWQNSGGNLNVIGGSGVGLMTYFSLVRVG